MSGSFCSRFSIAVRPPSSLPLVTSWPTMRGSSSSPMSVRILDVDAEALHEALVAQHVDRRLRLAVRSRKAILASAALSPSVLGPLADQLAGLEVVGREGRVGGVDRLERRVERDHQDAGVARLLDRGTIALVSLGVIRMPLAPAAIRFSIAATWLSLSPSTCRRRSAARRRAPWPWPARPPSS